MLRAPRTLVVLALAFFAGACALLPEVGSFSGASADASVRAGDSGADVLGEASLPASFCADAAYCQNFDAVDAAAQIGPPSLFAGGVLTVEASDAATSLPNLLHSSVPTHEAGVIGRAALPITIPKPATRLFVVRYRLRMVSPGSTTVGGVDFLDGPLRSSVFLVVGPSAVRVQDSWNGDGGTLVNHPNLTGSPFAKGLAVVELRIEKLGVDYRTSLLANGILLEAPTKLQPAFSFGTGGARVTLGISYDDGTPPGPSDAWIDDVEVFVDP